MILFSGIISINEDWLDADCGCRIDHGVWEGGESFPVENHHGFTMPSSHYESEPLFSKEVASLEEEELPSESIP
jgi:hypothetical protein